MASTISLPPQNILIYSGVEAAIQAAVTDINNIHNGQAPATVTTGVTATGTTQATAKLIPTGIVEVTGGAAASGVILVTGATGFEIILFNSTAVSINAWPAVGASIGSSAVNAAVAIAAGKSLHLFGLSATHWGLLTSA